jgi:hypothetical protein
LNTGDPRDGENIALLGSPRLQQPQRSGLHMHFDTCHSLAGSDRLVCDVDHLHLAASIEVGQLARASS